MTVVMLFLWSDGVWLGFVGLCFVSFRWRLVWGYDAATEEGDGDGEVGDGRLCRGAKREINGR